MSLKNIMFALSFIIPFHTHTMDKSIDLEKNESSQEHIFYFAKLSGDIWNLIAQYLTFPDRESQEEFINRAKMLKQEKLVLSKYSHHLISDRERCFPEALYVSKTLIAHCPNETNIAFLRFLCAGNHPMPELIVIDKRKNMIKNKIPWRHKRDNTYCFALSRNGQIFATVSQTLEIPLRDIENGDTFKSYPATQNILIQETLTQKIIQNINCDISESSVDLIAFNKQGTHIIVQSTHSTEKEKDVKKNLMPHHLIFPVTVNIDTPENGVITEDMIKARNTLASQKTLQHYFHQKGVCKSIIQ